MRRLFFYQIVTILFSVLLLFVPVPEFFVWFKPDWVLLNLIFWSVFIEGSIPLLIVWVLGFSVDAVSGIALGTHAFSYILVLSLAFFLKTQMSLFTNAQRLFFVIILMSAHQIIFSMALAFVGHQSIIFYWGPIMSTVIAWPLWSGQLQKIGKISCYE